MNMNILFIVIGYEILSTKSNIFLISTLGITPNRVLSLGVIEYGNLSTFLQSQP